MSDQTSDISMQSLSGSKQENAITWYEPSSPRSGQKHASFIDFLATHFPAAYEGSIMEGILNYANHLLKSSRAHAILMEFAESYAHTHCKILYGLNLINQPFAECFDEAAIQSFPAHMDIDRTSLDTYSFYLIKHALISIVNPILEKLYQLPLADTLWTNVNTKFSIFVETVNHKEGFLQVVQSRPEGSNRWHFMNIPLFWTLVFEHDLRGLQQDTIPHNGMPVYHVQAEMYKALMKEIGYWSCM